MGDFETSFLRSLQLGLVVMALTVVISLVTGLAFRKKFFGSNLLFYTTVASLIVPSILVSLGIGLIFNIMGWEVSWTTSGLGAHLTWTLPFGFLIMICAPRPAYRSISLTRALNQFMKAAVASEKVR